MQSQAIFLMGPTAAGKTALAFELVDRFNCEIISVDSALIYRDMNIGTAKPDPNTLQKYPHHLVDIIAPTQTFSVAEFCRAVNKLTVEICSRGVVPLFVGGTMMYFNALENGLAALPQTDQRVRQNLLAELEVSGLKVLFDRLYQIDEVTARRLHQHDTQRILRALEVWEISGKPLSVFHQEQQSTATSDAADLLKICVSNEDRSVLHKKIAQRFDEMLDAGFVEEVAQLRKKYASLERDMPSMRCVGYRQVWSLLENEYDIKTLREKGIVATRQLAKRQLTWLRGMNDIRWFESEQALTEVAPVVESFLNLRRSPPYAERR